MSSERLEELRESIALIRKHLLPSSFEPTGIYDEEEKVTIYATSFRMLAHAEIESYFEDRAVIIAKKAWKYWIDKKTITRCLLHLLAFSGLEMSAPPETLEAPTREKEKTWSERISIEDRLSRAVSNYIKFVTKENHGIKERNIIAILLPIGVKKSELDGVLIAAFNSFGSQRGAVAHGSARSYVTQSIDPKTELDTVNNLLTGIEDLDEKLTKLESEIGS